MWGEKENNRKRSLGLPVSESMKSVRSKESVRSLKSLSDSRKLVVPLKLLNFGLRLRRRRQQSKAAHMVSIQFLAFIS